MKKWIEKLSRNFGFTQTEISIILFLFITFLLGLVISFIKQSNNNSEYLSFDYSVQDSMFNAASGNIEIDDSISKRDSITKVASKNELLDFGASKNKAKEKNKGESVPKPVNINKASIKQLITLPGIGIKTAENIVNYRAQIGKFTNAGQLLKVKGIGKLKLEKIKKYLLFD